MVSLKGLFRRRPPDLCVFRDDGHETAIVLVHGFAGHPRLTWGDFPKFLVAEPRLAGWDVLSLGYKTNLRLDIPSVWSATPDLKRLARLLATAAAHHPRLKDRRLLGLVAHSMGGLVVQRALLDHRRLVDRVGHVVLFGTPSWGLKKARLGRLYKRQVRDMADDSEFIRDLRRRWSETFGGGAPFHLLSVAGDSDEFVPFSTSAEHFATDQQAVVPGNHVEIVKPRAGDSLSVTTLADFLAGRGAPAGPWNGARIAVERRDFQQAVDRLWPVRGELDDQHLVVLALALESLGKSNQAIDLLEAHTPAGTDVLGVLAGRLKRRWQAEGRRQDLERAEELYDRGLKGAEERGDHAQALYHGINLAYLALARSGDENTVREHARRALEHCEKAPRDLWNLATRGEAYLLLQEDGQGLAWYQQALAASPTPRQIESMFAQANRIAEIRGGRMLARRLAAVFRGAPLD